MTIEAFSIHTVHKSPPYLAHVLGEAFWIEGSVLMTSFSQESGY